MTAVQPIASARETGADKSISQGERYAVGTGVVPRKSKLRPWNVSQPWWTQPYTT